MPWSPDPRGSKASGCDGGRFVHNMWKSSLLDRDILLNANNKVWLYMYYIRQSRCGKGSIE